ncbi:BREX-1 system adenine-specific DNA-methyltransferase PglX [Acinetobacter johnsonii]|uniref:site-specific DNA-methyltransferase (adenine-specific) n=1 Tax=Acinetobacter johnsonii TaxID=40214 RepID=A0AA43BIA8_ACIJO|nr:BREX-1 system adenine-specific DNA-methyltransferase PglX [Acinetobacter johnsonii]MDH2172963.1 BREX-1 system adenine-specific DNA-methyltransferase PglX [Acinetobacter johnsonii]MDH2176110.1 BREX-1 system adenine-specific DNA-methyltransferase PglX [Acinetobacter johnsonii]
MNTANIKKYAPQAREDFIAAITQQATKYGIYADRIEDVQRNGDVALIGDGVFPASIIQPREQLIQRIEAHGFEQTLDYIAYSWFNRLCAIRYLEVHDFLAHGRRVLSSADGSAGLPQILEDCLDIDLPGLSQERIAELKLAGNKDEELYRELLLAQCRRLHDAMPLLFEPLANDIELLLPDNLTKTDSLIRGLVSSVPEEDWANIEIIGWLYQFYISAKKDQVIGKVVKTEDIPAATQLFTPNWIVKYLVQNSVGRLWMMANPASTTKAEWEYYIQPAEQTEEVQKQLNALIQTRIDEDGIQLNPESITVLDPACGSGHILVEAYDCLKAMYLERGYRSRDIPRLILEKNLFGLDIDDRAAQLASFALLMKAREDDRTLLRNPPKLNIMALQETGDLDETRLWNDLNLNAAWKKGSHEDLFGSEEQDLSSPENDERFKLIQEVLAKFENAKTFGSLICMDEPEKPYTDLKLELEKLLDTGDTLQKAAVKKLVPLLTQAMLLAKQYDAVIANPPYMGQGYFNESLKKFAIKEFDNWSGDLFTCFIKKAIIQLKENGIFSLITIGTWTFLPTYKSMREELLHEVDLCSIVDNGRGVWGSDHGSLMFTGMKKKLLGSENLLATKYLSKGKGKVQPIETIEKIYLERSPQYLSQNLFKKIPNSVIAIGASLEMLNLFLDAPRLHKCAKVKQGIKTGDIQKFLRFWFEVDSSNIEFNSTSVADSKLSDKKWYPCNKGGEFKKWFGNEDYILNWKNDGYEIRNFKDESGNLRSRPQNTQFFFKEGITWSTVTMGKPSFRLSKSGRIFESGGSTLFSKDEDIYFLLGVLNSSLGELAVGILSPKVSLGEGAVSNFPIPTLNKDVKLEISKLAFDLVQSSKELEELSESSFHFKGFNFSELKTESISDYCGKLKQFYSQKNQNIYIKENKINELVVPLASSTSNDIPKDSEVANFNVGDFSSSIISYALGCMMGRYSLDEPGLIYAHAGNEGFDPNRYKKFKADADGIIPLTEMDWFDKDEADYRIKEFLNAVWGKDTEAENMLWLAEGLAKKNNETPEEAVRRYLATKFYKDHLQTYKKRPIYWLFSSGKLGAFQALVYLHRYNESTLARMRTEYVMPLISKMAAYAKTLEDSKEASSSAAETNRIEKQLLALHKQQAELSTFEEKLRHLADQRITLDLDDGVKVNYGKFGDLLAEVKAVTGEK